MINSKLEKYIPGISELYHIIGKLKQFKNSNSTSNLKINLDWVLDFPQYSHLDSWGCWSYSYSLNEISLKFVNENNVASKVFKNDEKFNLILLDDIELISWDWYQGMIQNQEEIDSKNITKIEFCDLMITELETKIKRLAAEQPSHKNLVKKNLISLKQLQKDGGNITLMEKALIQYYTQILLKWITFSAEVDLTQRIPFKVLEFKRSDNFEERLAESLSNVDAHIDYTLYLMIKDNLKISAKLIEYHSKISLKKEKKSFPITSKIETFKKLFIFLKENLDLCGLEISSKFLFSSMYESAIFNLFNSNDFYKNFYSLYKIAKE